MALKRLCVNIDESLYNELTLEADKAGTTTAELCRKALSTYCYFSSNKEPDTHSMVLSLLGKDDEEKVRVYVT